MKQESHNSEVSNTPTRSSHRLPGPFLVFLLIVNVGLFLVSYSAGVALLLGIVSAWVLTFTTSRVVGWVRRSRERQYPQSFGPVVAGWSDHTSTTMHNSLVVVILVVLGIVTLLATPVFLISSSPQSASKSTSDEEPSKNLQVHEAKTTVTLTRYTATIEPKDGERFGVFTVVEKVSVTFGSEGGEEHLVSMHTLTPENTDRGILLRKAQLQPVEAKKFESLETGLSYDIAISPFGRLVLEDPAANGDMTVWEGILCFDRCPPSEIKLLRFPLGAFAATDNKDGPLDVEPFQNTEEVTWEADDLDRNVAFSYLRPPLCCTPMVSTTLGTALRPLERFSSLGTAFIFVVGAAVFSSVKFIVSVLAEQKLIDWRNNYLRTRQRRTADAGPTSRRQERSEKEEPNITKHDNAAKKAPASQEKRPSKDDPINDGSRNDQG
jgi:hypothetical protein